MAARGKCTATPIVAVNIPLRLLGIGVWHGYSDIAALASAIQWTDLRV